MEIKVEQSTLDETKQIVEQEIAEYLKKHPGYGKYGYLNNFDAYLQNRPGTAIDYRGHMLCDEYKGKTHRQLLLAEQGISDPEKIGFSKRYLGITGEDFVADIDKAMNVCGITLDQVMKLHDELVKLAGTEAYGKATEDLSNAVLPVYVYMRALGYNKYPELTS
ncbi:hypothetical protein A3A14_01185 [Candidatus Daviesbacteria bacterium RIFCSPLOWO2_01_FULL_43_38]|uniref:Uncharacterized protein n=1 Tax=Candidatus Daviesbacteria bacterium RIFCSPHIGHO2_12_FULL_43_11 TaxID=1797780 RepID=A0A1F5K1Z1_9BACT|nr:MAG: hypothetical protein A2874_01770 [Candidatus Daviesbacteria bacterium RIFCSPHIGHO2_01_FULL_43_17]OGE34800.1 MAG: hypothetical protein A3E45_02385 [Candidatus Daviesbacteria bacterium RIFCSPHIGHO2_12_FULL_43_11]OGE63214.1 MAG: hypothetical protein A3A14_01185 [Candidatus Daviesbacteria bacterium RIFCSPLOWO2_01_FULL_43_38]OGE69150.1 MAG: hypothetical protein A3J21_01965 [Candidatus Daviesbacteria bacterium RIFCSPLOWO2_02_FULL_43_11]